MTQSPHNNMHHVHTLPLYPLPWTLVVLIYISITQPNTPLCFSPNQHTPQRFLGEVCVCVCSQF